MSFSEPGPTSQPDAVTFARMEGKLDRVLDRLEALHGDTADHEKRIRAVEANYVTRSMVAGWIAAVIALVMAVAAVLTLVVR